MCCTYAVFVDADIDLALVIIPCRYLMSPPELPADAPILYVLKPVKIGIFVVFWIKGYLA